MVTTTPLTLQGFLLPYCEHFRKQGWQVDAAARDASGRPECARAFDRVWNIDWSRSPADWNNFFVAPAQIRAAVAAGRYDVVHVHTPVAAFVTRAALRPSKTPRTTRVVYTAHGFHFHSNGSPLKNALFASLERLAGRWTDYLVVINREDEAAARRLRIVPPENVRYMPGIGVDTGHYSRDAVRGSDVEALRSSLGLRPGQPLFTIIAEFNPGKRHEDAIHALAGLNDRHAHLACAGAGPRQEAMRRLCVQLKVEDRVSFLGFRNDIPALIASSTAVVLPSNREGLPRSVMEALCLGVPVIGTDIRGIQDLLRPGGGILYKTGSVEQLRQAMQFILDRPERAAEMSRIGRETMADYSLDKLLEHHEALYREALEGSAIDAKRLRNGRQEID